MRKSSKLIEGHYLQGAVGKEMDSRTVRGGLSVHIERITAYGHSVLGVVCAQKGHL